MDNVGVKRSLLAQQAGGTMDVATKDKEARALLSLLKSTKLPQHVLEDEVVPVFLQMEVTTAKLLQNFAYSKEQKRLAESLGMKPASINALERTYSRKNFLTLLILLLLFFISTRFMYTDLSREHIKRAVFGTPVRCKLGHDFTEYKQAKEEVLNLFHSTDRIRIESTKVKDMDLKIHKNGHMCIELDETSVKLVSAVQSTMHALWVASILERTLVAPSIVSSVYNVKKWQNMYPSVEYKMVIPYRSILCPQESYLSVDMPLAKLNERTKDQRAIMLKTEYVTKLFQPDKSYIRAFYSNVWPLREIVNIVDRYIYDNFGDKPFGAVHLRWFKGTCETRMVDSGKDPSLCSPKREVVESILKRFTMQKYIPPIFIISDNENKEALNTYSGDYFYKGDCSGIMCMVIAYEIAARANYFVGVEVSKASVLIAMLRNHRQLRNGVFYPSVLNWGNDTDTEELQDRWFTKTPHNVKYCPDQSYLFI